MQQLGKKLGFFGNKSKISYRSRGIGELGSIKNQFHFFSYGIGTYSERYSTFDYPCPRLALGRRAVNPF